MLDHLRLLVAPLPLVAACSVPGWPAFPPYCDPEAEACPPGQDGSSTTDTTGVPDAASSGVQTVTGTVESTTGADTQGPVSTDPIEPGEPAVIEAVFTPDPIELAGRISVDVTAAEATGVRMERPGAAPVELKKAPNGHFIGEIDVLTGLSNGTHEATFFPRRGEVEGTSETAVYSAALPPPGAEVMWDAVPDDGLGQIEALAVLGDDAIVGLGTLFDGSDARCYVHRRNLDGTYNDADVQVIFPEYPCTAVDLLTAGDAIYLLVQLTGGDGPRWRMATMAWGAAPTSLRTGAKGETAHALARSANGTLVACGLAPSAAPGNDTIDGRYWTFNGPSAELDYIPPSYNPHFFDETVRDCAFADDRLVLVGEVFGIHEKDVQPQPPERKRPFVLEIDGQGEPHWTVPGMGPGNTTQGAASKLAIDDQGRYIVGLYTCGDACDPEAELRIYKPGGVVEWQVTLPASVSAPFDVAWSPAGYVIVAGAQGAGWSTKFLLQGYLPGTYESAWTYSKAKQGGPHVAFAVAVAPGVVVGAGTGSGSFPVFAVVRP